MQLRDGTLQPKDVEGFNFRWLVDVYYSNEYDCSSYGCDEEGICRCSTIRDAVVEKLPSMTDMVNQMFRDAKREPVLEYCVDRLLRQYVKSKDDFSIDVGRGYYGEEIDGVFLFSQQEFAKEFKIIKDATTITKKLNHVLLKEYGHILPKMKDFKYEVQKCNLEDIKIPNTEYLQRIDANKVKQYEEEIINMNYPFGVCDGRSNDLVLIDGYHRYLACKNIGQKSLEVFVGK